MTVGREIRRLREQKGWTQAKLGVESGVGPAGVSHIETGRRNPHAGTLQRIADALEVEVRDLFPKPAATPSPSLTASALDEVLEAAHANMTLLEGYYDNPPDEDTADAAIFDFLELTPRAMELLAEMDRDELGGYADRTAKLIRRFAQISRRLDAWNEAQYGHRHRDVS